MAIFPTMTTTLLFSSAMGLLSAYIAYRRDKNPLFWFFIGFFFGMLGTLFLFFAPKAKKPVVAAPALTPAKQPYLFGPSDKFWYYLDPSDTQIGPMSYKAISDDWKLGKINADTLIWHEDLADWQSLKELIRI